MSDPITRLNAALEGRYTIARSLGEGGMAHVFLAADHRHDRPVAIKVLKPEIAATIGAERFLTEIKTSANLQHPHILPVHDSGEADGLLYFVMPFIEGESLADRLTREGQLPVDEAVTIASKVGGALHAAHVQGVIHRDVKPGNILLQGGEPIVADFGISLAVTRAGGPRLTEAGVLVGTPYYMSPEQAAGDREVGARSDVYALGCVLYEMLVGNPPYTGSTAQAVLAQVLTETPRAPTSVRAAVPPNVDGAVLKALERLPADRFTTAAEFSKALADPGFRHGLAQATGADAGSERWKRIAVGLGLTTVLTTAGLTGLLLSGDAPPPVARYSVGLPRSQPVTEGFGSNVTISPDGSAIVYVGPTEDRYGGQLWLRQRDQLLPTVVAGTEGAVSPVYSPDGGRVAFTVGGNLRITSLAGEPPLEILSDHEAGARPSGLAWSEDGFLYYSKEPELWRVRATGGEPEVVVPVEPDEVDVMHRWPEALPGGRGVLFTIADAGPSRNMETWMIAVVDTESGERRTLLSGALARYARSGHLVYVSADGNLLAVPFDVGSLRVTGDPVSLPGTARVGLDGIHLDVSAEGTLVYLAGVAEERVRPVWVSREGLARVVDPDWSGRMYFPSLSPDGSRIAVDMLTESNNVWIKQLDAGPQLRLTRHEAGGARAVWTPDGNAVSFFSVRGGNEDVWTRRADGSGPAELTFDGEVGVHEVLWSPDGEWLVYRAPEGAGIYAIRPGDDDEPVTLVETDADELSPTLSPDGRYMAFMSNETGRYEIYVVPFPGTADARWAVSTGGGRSPRWSPAGGEIFFIDAADNMVSVPVETAPLFTFGTARVLFPAGGYAVETFYHPPYDVTADGQRFLMLEPVGSGENQLVAVQGFFEVLEEEAGR
jgi:serine/threonine-protein kinase